MTGEEARAVRAGAGCLGSAASCSAASPPRTAPASAAMSMAGACRQCVSKDVVLFTIRLTVLSWRPKEPAMRRMEKAPVA